MSDLKSMSFKKMYFAAAAVTVFLYLIRILMPDFNLTLWIQFFLSLLHFSTMQTTKGTKNKEENRWCAWIGNNEYLTRIKLKWLDQYFLWQKNERDAGSFINL